MWVFYPIDSWLGAKLVDMHVVSRHGSKLGTRGAGNVLDHWRLSVTN